MTSEKKDLTSLTELPPGPEPVSPDGTPSLSIELPKETVTDADFGSLEELSQAAAASTPEPAPEPEPVPALPLEPPAADLPSLDLNLSEETAQPAQEEPPLPIVGELNLETSAQLPVEPVAASAPIVEPIAEPAAPKLAEPNNLPEPPQTPQDLSDIRQFGEKIAPGHPRVEANPPFSLMLTGSFDEGTRDLIMGVVTGEDLGIVKEDLEIQLDAGRVLVPRISKFTAIVIAGKVRDRVRDIRIGPASEIFAAESLKDESDAPSYVDHAHTERVTEAHDLSHEPQSVAEVFSTNLAQPAGFEITRMLSALTVSEVIPAFAAMKTNSEAFEKITEQLTQELALRAFKLGAHGVIGVSFNVKSSGKQALVVAMGTAVRVRKKSQG